MDDWSKNFPQWSADMRRWLSLRPKPKSVSTSQLVMGVIPTVDSLVIDWVALSPDEAAKIPELNWNKECDQCHDCAPDGLVCHACNGEPLE